MEAQERGNETMLERLSRRQQEDAEFERVLQGLRVNIVEKNKRRNERKAIRDQEDANYYAEFMNSRAQSEPAGNEAPVENRGVTEEASNSGLDFSNVSATRFNVNMPRMTTLTDLYDHDQLRDFVHQVERNSLQGEVRKLIERSASDAIARKISASEPDEAVFRYLQERLVSVMGERKKIKYWAKRIEFSMDFTTAFCSQRSHMCSQRSSLLVLEWC